MLESFGRETAGPFLFQQKGVAWALPLHETSETYLSGVAFMVGATFIFHQGRRGEQATTLSEAGALGMRLRGEGSSMGAPSCGTARWYGPRKGK